MIDENKNFDINSALEDLPDFDQNRPRMRKVKRPKMPGNPNNPSIPPKANFNQQQNVGHTSNAPEQGSSFSNVNEVDAFNLDSFLDEEINLPTVSHERDSFEDNVPQFIEEGDIESHEHSSTPLMANDMFSRKAVAIISLVIFILGFSFAKMFFTEETVVRDGLQGVVINPEVPKGRARCGVAERIQGCVLYIMNPQRQDLNARDFYDLAAQLTGRQRFVIETGNMRYSNVKIRPGNIAQLNIPPLQ